jgi:hypothetical protein
MAVQRRDREMVTTADGRALLAEWGDPPRFPVVFLHGAWLGEHNPGAEVAVDQSAGHIEDLEGLRRSLEWLVAPG